MGWMRFTCPAERVTEDTARQAYLCGYDRTPWKSEWHFSSGQLQLQRNVSDSGNLNIPWRVPGRGLLTLSTGTLMERPEPYHLPLELARGKIGQLRNQISQWQAMGFVPSDAIDEHLADAVALFAQAVVGKHGSAQSNKLAEQAIFAGVNAADLLAASYAEEMLEVRKHNGHKLPSLLGAGLGGSLFDDETQQYFLSAFNAVNVPLSWREIEPDEGRFQWDAADAKIAWAQAVGLKVCAGPLLEFDRHGLPDWLTPRDGNLEPLAARAARFIQAAVARYRSKVGLWLCAGRVNASDALSLGEEDKVRLAAQAVVLVRQADPKTPAVVAFDQPWGEYLSRRQIEFSPLYAADALVRANLGLSGLALEINVGYEPGGSLHRDPLEFHRLLEAWSLLGVPLFAILAVPSDGSADPLASREAIASPGDWTPETQADWVDRYVPFLLSEPGVHGVIWSRLEDGQPHTFAHGGLLDRNNRPKPALASLAAIRQAHLQ